MQSALRSAVRRSAGISSRRGVTTTTKAATASEPRREWVDEKAWVAAMVQREVRAQMAEEEERRITRDRLRAEAEEWLARRRLADEVEVELRLMRLWRGYSLAALEGWVLGAGLAILLFGR